MTHVMHVIDSLAVGGSERMAVLLANRAAADGYQVSVCVTRSARDLEDELMPEIRVWTLSRKKKFQWKPMFRFSRLIRDNQVDLLHVHGRSSFSFVTFMKAIRLVKLPVILHHHSGIQLKNGTPRWFHFLGRHFFTRFVAVSEKIARWAENTGVPADRIDVIENAMDFDAMKMAPTADLRSEFGISKEVLIGITIANFRHEKGIDLLIHSYKKSLLAHQSVLLLVGKELDPAYTKYCRQLIADLGLTGKIVIVLQRRDVWSLLKGADFAVMPSRFESGPLSLIEAAAAGLPFVSTLTGSVAQKLAERNVSGFVPPDDVDALASALDRLLSESPEVRSCRGKTGQDLVFSEYDIHRVAPRWYELYDRILKRK